MKKLIPLILLAALAGCSAGQTFGPTLRSGCQQAALDSVPVKEGILAAVTVPSITPERKEALKDCSRNMTLSRNTCDANPTADNVDAENAQTKQCKALLTGGAQ